MAAVAPAPRTEGGMDQPGAGPQKPAAEDAVPREAQSWTFGQYIRWRPLPWWLCFFGGIFLLTKFQLVYNDSPCAVLGTPDPVTSADVKKAFRSMSMCTHPDRIRGRLKREPTKAELRRGEILFNRASVAKDELTKMLKMSRKKEVMCYQGEMEMAIMACFAQAGSMLSSLGMGDIFGMAFDLFWNIVTFEAGFFNTLLSLLWLGFVFRLVKQFVMYLWTMGIIRGFVALVTTVVIGPVPTLINFLFLPVIRMAVFINEFLRPEHSDAQPAPADDARVTAPPVTDTTPSVSYTAGLAASTAGVAVSKEDVLRLRQRKKRETDEEKDKKNKALLAGAAEATAALKEGAPAGLTPMPEGAWACVAWAHKEPVKARQAAATAVQFDLLLILTKPVIPLCMLIASGQVWNGLISSMVIGHALRKWVPQMSYEAHHLLVSSFGVVHTLLGVSASQVEDYANREGTKVLHLAWSWSFKDVLSVMHMCQLGATVTAMSSLGNEPSYAASFGAGIALRMALAQDTFRSVGVARMAGDWIEANMRSLGVSMDAAEEVVVYSGGGIGDCAGLVWLMLMPLLSTLQQLGTDSFMKPCFVQVVMLARMELNASNGALANFWVAMLFGCVGESLLSTYDIRGPVRQIVFLLSLAVKLIFVACYRGRVSSVQGAYPGLKKLAGGKWREAAQAKMPAAAQVLVVGAGVTGSFLAMMLKNAGVSVRVLDKAPSPGGRMSTYGLRGTQTAGDFPLDRDNCSSASDLGANPVLARSDMGAQYISTRSRADHPQLGPLYEELLRERVLRQFEGKFEGPDPYGGADVRHFTSPEGFEALSRHFLAAAGVQPEFGTVLDELSLDAEGQLQLRVSRDKNVAQESLAGPVIVVLTQPVPQILGQTSEDPLRGNFLDFVDSSLLEDLRKVQYSSRFAAAVFFDAKFKWPYDFTVQYFTGGDVRYVCHDSSKRGATGESMSSIVVHSGVPLGVELLEEEEPFTEAWARMRKDLATKMPEVDWASASATKVVKWRYSQIYKGIVGERPAANWVWGDEEVEKAKPGVVTLFRKGQVLGLLAGDATAPTSNFESCVYSAHRCAAAVKAFLAEVDGAPVSAI
ncbi:unnamed protein product [Polarella glacialis]|uniref:Amine oxidase domain-containing protein n=1 Tax=Polarella glacialis TaxID=89957 RepID=A0A813KD66_POLGL|nr:unnamed protein product [Polarella glacialis]